MGVNCSEGENGRLTSICVHIDKQGYWTSQFKIGVHLAVTFQLCTVSDSCYQFCSQSYIAFFLLGFIKVPRLVLNVFIVVTNFIIEGNLFQACDATEKKVLAICLSLIAGNSYSSPRLFRLKK